MHALTGVNQICLCQRKEVNCGALDSVVLVLVFLEHCVHGPPDHLRRERPKPAPKNPKLY